MVFTQQSAKTPAEAKVKCTLVPLTAKATTTERYYVVNASKSEYSASWYSGATPRSTFSERNCDNRELSGRLPAARILLRSGFMHYSGCR